LFEDGGGLETEARPVDLSPFKRFPRRLSWDWLKEIPVIGEEVFVEGRREAEWCNEDMGSAGYARLVGTVYLLFGLGERTPP
jgi:hypothetical protein